MNESQYNCEQTVITPLGMLGMLQVETLLAKFGCKGQRYGSVVMSTPEFSADDQLAMVGMCWNKSPTGWQCLMFEYVRDQGAYRELVAATIREASDIMQTWRGPLHAPVLTALSVTAIAEVSQRNGLICGECNGSGQALSKKKLRKCPACSSGFVKWTDQTRFAIFSQSAFVPYERFIKYSAFLATLIQWLLHERSVALLAINTQIKKEEKALRLA